MTLHASKTVVARSELERAETRVAALEREVAQLREAVASHADVDRAVGVIVATARVSPVQAWDVLRKVSQHTNIKLRQLAVLLTRWGHTRALPTTVRTELYRQLRTCQERRRPSGEAEGDRPAF
ncbi:ANTAR domain-containing protein [Streptomyces sp. NPDC046939]|uniref:ANTAR domain-containing protein n=1 Tax=Streptomyces sp. NPDC046939 TaxID=3155376 RepID=UPI0033C4C6BC